jgi:hypothetical protein
MQSVRDVADAVEYRPPKVHFRLGIVVALLLGAAAIVTLGIAHAQRDVAEVYSVGAFFGCMALANGAMALHSLRHRLVMTPEIVRKVGLFAAREVRLAEVRRVEWKSFLHHGAVVLHEENRRLRIGVGEYEARDRLDLVRRLRTALADRPQEGWERFESRCLPRTSDWTASEARFRSSGVEYRMPAAILALGFMIGVASAGFGILGVYGFLFPDPSLKNPLGFLVFAETMAAITLVACAWMVRSYLRHRFVITPELVRLTSVFGTREVPLASVDRVVWKTTFGPAAVLHHGDRSLKISFRDFDVHDQPEMIHLLHMAAAGRTEEGWDSFGPRWTLRPVDRKEAHAAARRTLRFVLIAWGIALPIMYAALACVRVYEEKPRAGWIFIAIIPAVLVGSFIAVIWIMLWDDLKDPKKGPQAD